MAPFPPMAKQAPLHSLLVSRLLTRQDCESLGSVCRKWRTLVAAVLHGTCSLLLSSDRCLRHHLPTRLERPERLHAVLQRLHEQFPRVPTAQALPLATKEQLRRVHRESYVEMVWHMSKKVERSMAAMDTLRQGREEEEDEDEEEGDTPQPQRGVDSSVVVCSSRRRKRGTIAAKLASYEQFEYVQVGDETTLMRYTLDAARVAAGGACLAVDRVVPKATTTCNAFCAVRPPGHHAERGRAMGFCVFNNVAVAALHALEVHGLSRVVIVDLDVHHGNGTQDVADKESRLLYVSMHQAAPCFPSSGLACEKGRYGNVLNVPLRAKCTAQTYRDQFSATVLPRVRAFCPELVMVSMGFDGSSRDPLGDFRLEANDYYWLTNQLCRVAWECCDGKLVSVMEGGYHLGALADGAEQHLLALFHGSCRPDGLASIDGPLLERLSNSYECRRH